MLFWILKKKRLITVLGLLTLNWQISLLAGSPSEPLHLEEAISFLKQQNNSVQEALHRLQAAQARTLQAESQFKPHFKLGSSYIGSDQPIQVFGSLLNQGAYSPSLDFNHVPTVDNLNVQSMMSYALFTSGLRTANLKASKYEQKAFEYAVKTLENDLILAVTETMLNVGRFQTLVLTAEKSILSMEANLSVAEKRRDAGTGLEQELLDIKVRLSEAKVRHLQARNDLEIAHETLRMLLAWPEDQSLVVAQDLEKLELPDNKTMRPNPEVLAVQAQREAAYYFKESTKAMNRPQVSLFGSYDTNHGWRTGESLGSWTAGVAMEWNIWNGGLNRAKTREAQANLDAIESQEEAARLKLNFEIRKARLQWTEASLRFQMTEAAVSLAEESLRLSRVRFQEGLGLANQLLDAETALTAARMNVVHADTEINLAKARLRHAMGLSMLDDPSQKIQEQ